MMTDRAKRKHYADLDLGGDCLADFLLGCPPADVHTEWPHLAGEVAPVRGKDRSNSREDFFDSDRRSKNGIFFREKSLH